MLALGLMSGTSMDGVDAALLETDGSEHIRCLSRFSLQYPRHSQLKFKALERCVRAARGDMNRAKKEFIRKFSAHASEWHSIINLSTHYHIQAVKQLLKKSDYSRQSIDVIGYPQQTLFHRPRHKISLTMGYPQELADEVGIPVVSDFRRNDIEHGGEGAPLAPIYHYALAYRDDQIPCVVVNCGGISNISIIYSQHEEDLYAFDAGPGNALIDRFVTERTQEQETMDCEGRYGRKGKVHENILNLLYQKSIQRHGKNYFEMPAPKSLDIGDIQLIPELNELSLEDACRTLETFTAKTLADSVKLFPHSIPKRWVLCGGGFKNPVICGELTGYLQKVIPDLQLLNADEMGWNGQSMEAELFAYLAVRSLQGKPLSFPGTTGVRAPVSGGILYSPKLS